MKKTMQKGQRLLSLLIAVWCFCATAWAQDAFIKGVVVDSQGESIIGATVVLKSDKTVGTTTDLDGNFSLKVPSAKSTLVVSYVGMKTVEVTGNGKILRIILDEDNEQLEEVVVVGYGQQKKASVVGAITQTTGKTLERAAGITSIGAALTGNLPGVVTMTSSAVPGEEDPKIVIRGSSSWNSSEPLILVDGIERPMSQVDMGSVESLSVLKDASATAVYGVKGANGVILITTKRGQEGRPQINVTANAIMKMPSKLPGKADSYDAYMMRNVALEHEMSLDPAAAWGYYRPMSFISCYRDQDGKFDENGTPYAERYANVDWQKTLFKDFCMSYNASLNISGGTKHVRYFAAVDYVNEGDLFATFDNGRGYTPKYGYNRINVRSNLDFKITNTTTFKVNISGSAGFTEATHENSSLDEWQVSQQFAGAFNLPPDVFLPKYSNGAWGEFRDVPNVTNSASKFALAGTNKKTDTRINTDFIIEQDLSFLTKGLNFRGTISWDNAFQETQRGIDDLYHAALYVQVDPETGSKRYSEDYDMVSGNDFSEGRHWTTNNTQGQVQDWATMRNLYYQLQLSWARRFGKHDLSAMALFSRSENARGGMIPNYREDWAFRATYNYGDRYLFEFNGAYNGSEKFASKNRFAFFKSGAIGWTISNEKFMKPVREIKVLGANLIDNLKVRASYGEIGDDSYGTRWLYMNQWVYAGSSKMDLNRGDNNYTWYRESVIGNPDIHWEVVRKLNVGVDYSFFDGLAAGSLEFFQDKRTDIIVGGGSRALPSYYGAAQSPAANLGKVTTKGYELELRLNKSFRGHRIWTNFNMTHAKNIINVRDDRPLLPNYRKDAGYSIGQQRTFIDNGFIKTMDDLYGTPQFDKQDNTKLVGDYYIVDIDGNGIVDDNDKAPYGYTGTPENTYNATIGYEWKGFSCFVQFYGVSNVTRYVGLGSFGDSAARLNTVFDQGSWWSQAGAGADVVTPRYASTPNESVFYGTQMYYDGSYVRLKNVELAYTWNQGWIKKCGINNLRLYVSANNLWTYTNMPDDREANGSNVAAYPTVKRINFGLKFTL